MQAQLEKTNINLVLRVRIALGICAVTFLILIFRLWYLQIVKGEHFRKASENNRLRTVYLPPPRGRIYDREGNLLAQNRPAFNIELTREDSPDPKATLRKLAALLDLPEADLLSRLEQTRARRRFEPQLILKDVSREIVAKVAVNSYRLPGVIVRVVPTRDYLYSELGSHVLGYVRQISKKQLDEPEFVGYRAGDVVGQYGIERKWERLLQGERGLQRVVVNAVGTRIRNYSFESERAGSDAHLTISLPVQRAAHQALKDLRGAVVAIDPQSGDLLALESSPAFDPNMFTREITQKTWLDLVAGKERRLNNRAVQGGYPPGSVFKIIMAAAGLAERVVTLKESTYCPGQWRLGRGLFRCHKRAGHGNVQLREALVHSCDVYFYELGMSLGIDRIHDYAKKFGLGEKTGLRLVEENPGLVPSTEWKRRYFSDPEQQRWYPGETPSVAIGQGALIATPIQMARAVAAAVNGGYVLRPRVLRTIAEANGRVVVDNTDRIVVRELGIKQRDLDAVKDGLVGVVNDQRGTGRRAQLKSFPEIKVGGKTGTSQVVSLDKSGDSEKYKDHAWFVGFAPAENPQIVVSALVENGGSGGRVAAPVVNQVLEAYFQTRTQGEVS